MSPAHRNRGDEQGGDDRLIHWFIHAQFVDALLLLFVLCFVIVDAAAAAVAAVDTFFSTPLVDASACTPSS
jgi:hypothetical protein